MDLKIAALGRLCRYKCIFLSWSSSQHSRFSLLVLLSAAQRSSATIQVRSSRIRKQCFFELVGIIDYSEQDVVFRRSGRRGPSESDVHGQRVSHLPKYVPKEMRRWSCCWRVPMQIEQLLGLSFDSLLQCRTPERALARAQRLLQSCPDHHAYRQEEDSFRRYQDRQPQSG